MRRLHITYGYVNRLTTDKLSNLKMPTNLYFIIVSKSRGIHWRSVKLFYEFYINPIIFFALHSSYVRVSTFSTSSQNIHSFSSRSIVELYSKYSAVLLWRQVQFSNVKTLSRSQPYPPLATLCAQHIELLNFSLSSWEANRWGIQWYITNSSLSLSSPIVLSRKYPFWSHLCLC